MVEDRREGWLRDLVVGDSVRISSLCSDIFGYFVTKVTDSGRIVVSNSDGDIIIFTPRGTVAGSKETIHSYQLYPYVLEEHLAILNKARKDELLSSIREKVRYLDDMSIDDSSLDRLEGIASELELFYANLRNG